MFRTCGTIEQPSKWELVELAKRHLGSTKSRSLENTKVVITEVSKRGVRYWIVVLVGQSEHERYAVIVTSDLKVKDIQEFLGDKNWGMIWFRALVRCLFGARTETWAFGVNREERRVLWSDLEFGTDISTADLPGCGRYCDVR